MQRRENCDRYSSTFEQTVERAAREEEEEEEEDALQNQDRFSSTFERTMERAAREEEEEQEEEGAQQNQDRFSSSFERTVEAELLGRERYSSLDSLDALSQADESHSCVSVRAPLTPLIQQRAMDSWEGPDPAGLSTVAEQEAPVSNAESWEAGPEESVVAGARRPRRLSPGRPWRNSITSSQSENVLNRPLPRALPSGFHSGAHGSLGSPSSLPNSVR